MGHVVCGRPKQTMPDAQSPSALHGPGTHALTGVVSHTGWVHGWFGAQAMSGQGAGPVVWQIRPLPQSASRVQETLARAIPGDSSATADATAAAKEGAKRRKVLMSMLLEPTASGLRRHQLHAARQAGSPVFRPVFRQMMMCQRVSRGGVAPRKSGARSAHSGFVPSVSVGHLVLQLVSRHFAIDS